SNKSHRKLSLTTCFDKLSFSFLHLKAIKVDSIHHFGSLDSPTNSSRVTDSPSSSIPTPLQSSSLYPSSVSQTDSLPSNSILIREPFSNSSLLCFPVNK
ncbi:hypothetical protein HMI55_005352, partial [Coelomomyces lativittatus]